MPYNPYMESTDTKEIRVLVPADLHRRLRVLGAEQDMSLAEIARQVLIGWVKHQEAKRG